MTTDSLLDEYAQFRDHNADGPLSNPILSLALSVDRQLNNGALSMDDLEIAINNLTQDSFSQRIFRLSTYLKETDKDKNKQILRDIFLENSSSFLEYSECVSTALYGFVITAHPTFSLNRELTQILVNLATKSDENGNALDENSLAALRQKAEELSHLPKEDLTLTYEQDFALHALTNMRGAIATVYETAIEVAQEKFPDRWTDLRPTLVTTASWVGLDLDGRQDISWATSFARRIDMQLLQIEYYLDIVETIPSLGQLSKTLATSYKHLKADRDFFTSYRQEEDPSLQALQAHAQKMAQNKQEHCIAPQSLLDEIAKILSATNSPDEQKKLCTLRAMIDSFGLTIARAHVRINAHQVHNAVRDIVDLESGADDSSHQLHKMQILTNEMDEHRFNQINFGDIATEMATAKRLFMMIQQIVRYIDGHTPVRFLIAECEKPATLLAALSLAKQFGVEDHVEICPLFETKDALRNGSRIIGDLIENTPFKDYIEKVGGLYVQTGYSDAGRYIGQTVACASIERLKFRLSRLLQDQGLSHIKLTMFDTHGDSIGRGGHPDSIASRVAYLAPPAFLTRKECGYKQESSFQGGDGYIPFMNPDAALASVTHILKYLMKDANKEGKIDDPYYNRADTVRAFFTTHRYAQDALLGSTSYAALLSVFGQNIMPRTGSRPVKRQREGSRTGMGRHKVSDFRAIPHNAILMQMGLQANVLTGLGQAIENHSGFYADMMERSPRFQSLMRIPQRAIDLGDPDTLKAYMAILDPSTWLSVAERHNDPTIFLKLANAVDDFGYHSVLPESYRRIYEDFIRLKKLDKTPEHEHYACLHAIRIALIIRIWRKAITIPGFAGNYAVGRQQLIELALHLDIPSTEEWMHIIFPCAEKSSNSNNFGDTSNYKNSGGYEALHKEITEHLTMAYRLFIATTPAIVHRAGWIG